MRKQSHPKLSLLIALDLCQAPYQVLLIIYLKDFILVSVWIVNLDYMVFKDDQLILGVLSVKRIIKTLIKNLLKDLQIYGNSVMEALINLFCC